VKPYWLCKDVRGFDECERCLRNPERAENVMAALEDGQSMRIPIASERSCADAKPASNA
jgi:hypothetical protein